MTPKNTRATKQIVSPLAQAVGGLYDDLQKAHGGIRYCVLKLHALEAMTFVSRLRWILTGFIPPFVTPPAAPPPASAPDAVPPPRS